MDSSNLHECWGELSRDPASFLEEARDVLASLSAADIVLRAAWAVSPLSELAMTMMTEDDDDDDDDTLHSISGRGSHSGQRVDGAGASWRLSLVLKSRRILKKKDIFEVFAVRTNPTCSRGHYLYSVHYFHMECSYHINIVNVNMLITYM